MNKRLFCLIFFFLLIQIKNQAIAQKAELKAVLTTLAGITNDSLKCAFLENEINKETNPAVWISYNELLKQIALKDGNAGAEDFKRRKTFLKYYASAINNEGFYLQEKGNIDSALSLYRQSLTMRYDIKDKAGILNSFNNIGFVYYCQSDFGNALSYYRKAYKMFDEKTYWEDYVSLLTNLGSTYMNYGDCDSAYFYFKRNLAIRLEHKDSSNLGTSYMNMNRCYYHCKNRDSATYFLKKALEIRTKLNDRPGLGNCYNSLSRAFLIDNQLDSAIYYANRSIENYRAVDSKANLPYSLTILGDAYLRKGNPAEAKKYLKESYTIAKMYGYPSLLAKPCRLLYNIYKKEGNISGALTMLETATLMEDSIASVNKIFEEEGLSKTRKFKKNDLAKDDLDYQLLRDSLTSKIEMVKGENIRKSNYLVFVSIVCIVFFFVIVYLLFRRIKTSR